MTKEEIELSKRAGKIMEVIDRETTREIVPVIGKAKSFDDLPKKIQDIIIEAEKKLKS